MKKILKTIGISLFFLLPVIAFAYTYTFQGGTGTTTPSGILYGDNGATNHLNTVSIGSNLTFSGGTLSATGSGGSGTGTVSTSTVPTIGNLAYWTSAGYPSLLGSVATNTLTASSPLTGSFTQIGSGGSLGCLVASGSQAGCLSSTDWTTFNNKTSNTGTVTSVGVSTPSGTLTLGGTNPVTTSGTISADLNLGHTNTWSVLQNFNYSSTTGYASFVNASSTIFNAGTSFIPSLGTAAGSYLAVNPSGQIIATTTPSGGGGSGTVNSGVAGQVGYYASNGTAVSGQNNLVIGTTSPDTNNIGIGTTTPWCLLCINPVAGSPATAFSISSSSSVTQDTFTPYGTGDIDQFATSTTSYNANYNTFTLANTGFFGIGSTTPGTSLSIGNIGGINFTPTATSTFGSSANGINLTSGCFAIGGTCIGGGSGTNYFTNTGIDTLLTTGSQLDVPSNGQYNIGGNLLAYASSTNQDTIFGLGAGGQNATTSNSVNGITAIGYNALKSLSAGTNETAVGSQALIKATGNSNTSIGSGSGLNTASGTNNTYLGTNSGSSVNGAGSDNVFIGAGAQSGSTGAGLKNIVIGSNSGNITTGQANISIGTSVIFPSATANGQLDIGNILYGTGLYNNGSQSFTPVTGAAIGIGTTTPTAQFSNDNASSTAGLAQATPWGSLLSMIIGGVRYMTRSYDYYGHLYTQGPQPTVSGGTSSMNTPSNDTDGSISVVGTALTSVTMTFAKPWLSAPVCTESDNVLVVGSDINSISSTQVVFGFGTGGVSTATIWYHCQDTR